jgi:hypothetical protein
MSFIGPGLRLIKRGVSVIGRLFRLITWWLEAHQAGLELQ